MAAGSQGFGVGDVNVHFLIWRKEKNYLVISPLKMTGNTLKASWKTLRSENLAWTSFSPEINFFGIHVLKTPFICFFHFPLVTEARPSREIG